MRMQHISNGQLKTNISEKLTNQLGFQINQQTNKDNQKLIFQENLQINF